MSGAGPVADNLRFDEAALQRYLRGRLPGFDGDIAIGQFHGGQSNPTFHIRTAAGEYVLRKQPPGKLLPSAHAVDREYRVMRALADSGVPVPKVHVLCTDPDVIGQMFFVMEKVPGRVLLDPRMPEVGATERRALHLDVARVLARLHRVDYREAGLADFGRPEGYVARQVKRWSTQYLASRVEDNADMDRLIEWLQANLPEGDETAIAHGDYRCHNVIFHATEPRVTAVIDWELATIGHPLGDLSYCCLPYHLPPDDARSFRGADLRALGIPSEAEMTEAYCREAGRGDLPNWRYFVIFSLFRTTAIRAGIYKRAVSGNAADPGALAAGQRYRGSAARGWAMASGSD